MASTVVASSTYEYAVFQYVREPYATVPVGVALWSQNGDNVYLRFVHADEEVSGLRSGRARQIVRTAAAQVAGWVRQRSLPYLPSGVPPTANAWWRHLASIMEFGVAVSEPLAIDCTRPAEEIEALFEAVVSPTTAEASARLRVDGVITRALGDVAARFETGKALPGFGGKPVAIRRLHRGPTRYVVAEGVNLASERAEEDADALASRLLRVTEGADMPVEFVIGYISSPEGLNGEVVYVDWLQHKLNTRPYDLVRQEQQFRRAATAATAPLQPTLPEVVGSG